MNTNLNYKTQGLKMSFSSNYFVMCSKPYNSLTKKIYNLETTVFFTLVRNCYLPLLHTINDFETEVKSIYNITSFLA